MSIWRKESRRANARKFEIRISNIEMPSPESSPEGVLVVSPEAQSAASMIHDRRYASWSAALLRRFDRYCPVHPKRQSTAALQDAVAKLVSPGPVLISFNLRDPRLFVGPNENRSVHAGCYRPGPKKPGRRRNSDRFGAGAWRGVGRGRSQQASSE